jgi:hypothetical protein
LRSIEIAQLTHKLSENLTGPVTDILGLTYTVGVGESKVEITEEVAAELRDDLSSSRLSNQVLGYASAYFERWVDPLIQKAFELISNNSLTMAKAQQLKQGIEHKLASESYWQTIGSVFAARAFNFAILDVGYYTGYRQYTISSPRNGKTGSVCDGLIGRTFPVDKGLSVAYMLETAAPGGDKLIYAWPTDRPAEEIEKLSDHELIDMGIIVPPFHPHCQSQVELIG